MRQFEKFQVSDLDSYFEEAYVGRTQSCFSRGNSTAWSAAWVASKANNEHCYKGMGQN